MYLGPRSLILPVQVGSQRKYGSTNLTDGVATGIAQITFPSTFIGLGGVVTYTVFAENDTETQSVTKQLFFSASRRGVNIDAINATDSAVLSSAITSGTLTIVGSAMINGGNVFSLLLNANTSLVLGGGGTLKADFAVDLFTPYAPGISTITTFA